MIFIRKNRLDLTLALTPTTYLYAFQIILVLNLDNFLPVSHNLRLNQSLKVLVSTNTVYTNSDFQLPIESRSKY